MVKDITIYYYQVVFRKDGHTHTDFIKAHNEILEQMKEHTDFKSEKEFVEMKQIHVKYLTESMFRKVDGDFNNPTKNSLIQVVMKLKEYAAASFRKPEIIEKHAGEIMQLINKLD